jgi:hypothetical protein
LAKLVAASRAEHDAKVLRFNMLVKDGQHFAGEHTDPGAVILHPNDPAVQQFPAAPLER